MDEAVRSAIDELATRPTILVATDFDGVLAPLVQDPMSSRPLPGTVDALRALSGMAGTTVAVVSGRDLETLGLLTGLAEDPDVVLFGSHGGQSSRPDLASGDLTEVQTQRLAALDAALTEIIEAHPGTRIERKPAAVVLHTRGVDDAVADAATTATVRMAGEQPGTHVMPGKCVVELSVSDADKGTAIEGLAEHLGADGVYYAGDDVTDEKAFAAMTAAGRGTDVTIKVGEGETGARLRVDSAEAAAEVLIRLAEQRGRHLA